MKLLAISPWVAVIAGMVSSSPGQEAPALETRSYDLGAVVGSIHNFPFVLRPQGDLILTARDGDSGPWDGIPSFGKDELNGSSRIALGDSAPQPAESEARFEEFASNFMERDALGERLRTHLAELGVAVDSESFWMTWSGSVLHLRAMPADHEKVRAFLQPLEEAGGVLIVTECLLVPGDALDRLAPAWRREGPFIGDDVFEKALAEPVSRLLSVSSRNGQRGASGSKDLRNFVVDQEVNQTGVIPVIGPVIETPFAGDRLEVRASLVPGEEAIWLDLAVGRAETSAKAEHLGAEWGELELPTSRETLLSTSAVVPPGRVFVAGSLEGEDWSVALVRARVRRARGVRSPAQTAGETMARAHDVSLLFKARPARRWPSTRAQDRFSLREARFGDTDQLSSFLGLGTSPGLEDAKFDCDGKSLFLSGPPEAHERVARLLQAELARIAQLAAIEIQLITVPRGLLARLRAGTEDGFVLRAGWENLIQGQDGAGTRRYSVTGITGQVHALRRAAVKSFVIDVYQVAGGTGFAIIVVSDPETGACGEGIELRVQVSFPAGSETARLQLEGAEAKITEERAVQTRFPAIVSTAGLATAAPDATEPVPGPLSMATVMRTIQLTLPRQAVEYWKTEMDVPLDRDAILHTSAGPGDTATLLVGRVRQVRRGAQ